MKEIQLSEKKNSSLMEFEPVTVGEGITIESRRSIQDGNCVIDGTINSDGKNIGRFTMNDKEDRLFVNVKTDKLDHATKCELVEAVASIIVQLTPADEEEEV